MDPGQVWDQLVSQCQTAKSSGISRKPVGLAALVLRKEKVQAILPEQPREVSQIDPEVRKAIRECLTGASPWPLVFFGPAGTGKTSAALCLCDYCLAMYATATSLCQDFRDADFGRLDVQTQPGHSMKVTSAWLWKKVQASPLVVLDELGCRDTVSDHHYEVVKGVIDKRQGRPLIAVSNLGSKLLAKVYDDRITDRLWAGTVVEFTGESRRLV